MRVDAGHAPSGPLAGNRRAVLFDFGGVLTSSVLDAFRAFGERACGDADLPLWLLGHDPEAQSILADHEKGLIDQNAFERGFAARLGAHGAPVEAEGLVAAIQAGLERDEQMISLVAALRSLKFPVGLVSNSLGRDCYSGYDLAAMFDAVAISGLEGVRKPSRRLYELGCARLGVDPGDVVMIDDLEHNIVAAERIGMLGIVHNDAATTIAAVAAVVGIDERNLNKLTKLNSVSG